MEFESTEKLQMVYETLRKAIEFFKQELFGNNDI
jgi:hypothetical protein